MKQYIKPITQFISPSNSFATDGLVFNIFITASIKDKIEMQGHWHSKSGPCNGKHYCFQWTNETTTIRTTDGNSFSFTQNQWYDLCPSGEIQVCEGGGCWEEKENESYNEGL